jgi:protein-S-isoprenylcysteine O-methyltransferase Ste14
LPLAVSAIDTLVVKSQNDTLVVILGELRLHRLRHIRGAGMGSDPVGEHADGSATAGAIGRPILLFPAAVLVGLALDGLLPLPFAIPELDGVPWIVAGSLILIGLMLFAAGVRDFSRAATPLPTNRPARVLVTTGIYRWTRNPIYLGFFLVYGGLGVATQGPWVLTLNLPLAIMIRYGVVAREEAYLERRFGDAYRDYMARVRRWL